MDEQRLKNIRHDGESWCIIPSIVKTCYMQKYNFSSSWEYTTNGNEKSINGNVHGGRGVIVEGRS